jgi:signal peptidase I
MDQQTEHSPAISDRPASAAPGVPGDTGTPTPRPAFSPDPPPPVQPVTGPQHTSGWQDFLSIIGVLISALVLAFCLITFVFQSYQVDGPSMQTTLHNRDYLFILKVPRTLASITRHKYIPHRGDVIVFNNVYEAEKKQLIKRVIGLPGEHVVVKDGLVTVYNKEHPDGFDPDKTLPYGKVITDTQGDVDLTVGNGQVFVMGDNRPNSRDSRYFGPVDSDQIVGKLVLRALPLNDFKRF